MEIINNNSINSKINILKSIIIAGLFLAIAISLYFYFQPKKDYRKIYDPRTLTIDEEIESYKKELGNTNNYVAYNRLAAAYVRQARATGDPSWYILAEKNAKLSLYNAPASNYGALMVLASTHMAKHEFSEAKKIARQMLDDPNAKIEALGIIFDADYAIGDLKQANKDLNEIEESKKEIYKYKFPNIKVEQIPDMVNKNRHALLSYSTGDTKSAEKYLLKAIKDSVSVVEDEPKAWIYTLYATFLIKNGRNQDAQQNIQYALNNIPNYTSALVQKSEIAREKGSWEEIIKNLSEVNDKAPRSDLLLRMAESEKKLGNQDKYIHDMDQAEILLKQETDIGGFGHRRDYIRLLLDKNTPESLKSALDKAESEIKMRKDLDTSLIVAETQIKNNKWSEAEKTINQAMNTGVKDAYLYYFDGKVLEHSGNIKKAKGLYEMAIGLNPDFNIEYKNYIKEFLTRNK